MPADVIINPTSGEIYWNDNAGSPQSISIRGDAQNKIDIIGYGASFSPGGGGIGTFVIATFNDSVVPGTSAFVPGTSGNDIGSATLRWKTFLTTTNISDTSASLGTNSTSLLSGLVQVNGGIAISGNASIGRTVLFFNNANPIYFVGITAPASLASTTTYFLPTNYPGTGTSILQSDTVGNLTWVPLAASSAGSATTAQNVQVSLVGNANVFHSVLLTPTIAAAGSAVSANGTLTYNTQTDILSAPGIAVTSGTVSTSTTSGAFQVKGGVGITGNAFIGGTINVASPITIPNGGTNVASFGQSAGFVYYDGVNVRLLAATGATINYTNGYYQFDNRVYASSFFAGGSQMPNGSGILGRVTIWSGNNTIGSDADFAYDSTNNILTVLGNINGIGLTISGIAATSTLNATSTTSAAMVVTGGLALGGNAIIGGSTIQSGVSWISNSTNATSTSSAALYVTGGLALGSNAFIGGTVYSTSTAWFNNSTPSISTSTGTLIVTGGVGIGGSLYTNTALNSSISGVNHLNSVITSGSWAATAITTAYGGHGAIPVVTKGDLLVGAGSTWYNLPYSASNNQVLTVDTATAFGVKWATVTAAAASVSVAAATGNTVVFLTATNADTGSGFALSTSTNLSFNPSVNTLSSTGITATYVRALQYLIPIGGNNIAWYASDGTTQLMGINTSNGWLRSYQTTNATTSSSAALVSSGGLAVATNAIIGGSTLQSGVSWINNSTNATTSSSAALYVTGGLALGSNAIIGGSTLQSGVSWINNATNATSTVTAALVVGGGLALGSNAFIGGTVYSTSTAWFNNTTSSISTATGTLIVNGGVGIGGSLYVSTSVPSNISGIYVANGVLSGSALTATASLTTTNIRTTASTLNIVDSGTSNTVLNYNGTRFGVLITADSTASNNGGLVTTGGAGFGGSINVNGNIGARSGYELRAFNTGDTAYTGFKFTGSASTTYILPATSPAIGNSVLQSTTGGVMSWVPMATGGGSPAGNNTELQFNNGGTFGGATGVTYQSTTYLVSIASTADQRAVTTVGLRLVNNAAVAIAGVQQRFSPALEIAGRTVTTPNIENFNRFVTEVVGTINSYGAQQQWKYSLDTGTPSYSNPIFVIHSQKGVGIGYSGITFQNFFRANASQAVELTYVLPVAYPGTGTSVLSSNTSGDLSWVPMTTGGSGTPGGSNRQIQYNNSSTFGGASGFEYVSAGNAVTVNIFATAGGGSTSGLSINTINGTTTRIGIGLTNPAFELEIRGELSATNKSFVIDHPTKPGMKLRYGSLEGPENGVYVRGQLLGTNIIETPDYWRGLVHDDSYTIHLTPNGNYQQLYVDKIQDYKVYVGTASTFEINCFYSIWAERKDISKLKVEY